MTSRPRAAKTNGEASGSGDPEVPPETAPADARENGDWRENAGETALARGSRPVGYARLVRVPNLFTAPPDVVAGAALAAAVTGRVADPVATVAALSAASVLLYAGGTALNDYADAAVDARERPDRPIPSGAVPRRAALAVGAGALAVGVAVATLGAGLAGGAVAGLLAAVVVAYDGALKGGRLGALAMGTARGANVLLGATAAGWAGLSTLASDPAGLFPAVVAAYIAAVTLLANDEAAGGSRRDVALVAAVTVTAGGAVVAGLWTRPVAAAALGAGAAAAAGLLAWNGRALRRAYATPTPATVGAAVGACVLGEGLLAGAAAAVAGVPWTLAAVGFLVPAALLSGRFDVS